MQPGGCDDVGVWKATEDTLMRVYDPSDSIMRDGSGQLRKTSQCRLCDPHNTTMRVGPDGHKEYVKTASKVP